MLRVFVVVATTGPVTSTLPDRGAMIFAPRIGFGIKPKPESQLAGLLQEPVVALPIHCKLPVGVVGVATKL